MLKISSILRLTRIEHSILLVVAVVAAELITKGLPSTYTLVLSVITPIFISMGSFAINDYFDVEADRINKKDRPIVKGLITKNEALAISLASFIVGIATSYLINVQAFIIAIIFSVLSFLYSYRSKEILLLGNSYVALSMAIPFIYGNFVVSNKLAANTVLIVLVIFLSGLAREIHGMIRDYKGDTKARKIKNIVYYIGAKRSSKIAFVLYLEAILISIFMFFFLPPFAYNVFYIVPIAVTDLVLFYVSYMFLKQKSSRRFYDMSRNLSLGAMGLALLAYLISALFYVFV